MSELLETGFEAEAVYMVPVRKSVDKSGMIGRIFFNNGLKALEFVRPKICPWCILKEICTRPGGNYETGAEAEMSGKGLMQAARKWNGNHDKEYSLNELEIFLRQRAACNNLHLVYKVLGWRTGEEEKNG